MARNGCRYTRTIPQKKRCLAADWSQQLYALQTGIIRDGIALPKQHAHNYDEKDAENDDDVVADRGRLYSSYKISDTHLTL